MKKSNLFISSLMMVAIGAFSQDQCDKFEGSYFTGVGDVEYLEHLDKAYRMIRPDSELENLSMLYTPKWNGFVEGPTWDAWWIQNSYGPTYTLLPFMDQCYQRFIFNSNALWFNRQGNGERKDNNGFIGPVGALCDCAMPDGVYYRQGDGDPSKHDWGFAFTTAGIVMQSELLLINRNRDSIAKYLPKIELAAEFVDTRRCPEKNIFLIGTSGNILAPSYAGTGKKLPDGTYEKAYLAEISVNYIAGLTRVIELEKMVGQYEKAKMYQERKAKILAGLEKYMTTSEGYLIRALAPDGTRHGEFGAKEHGYFDAIVNHDAMAFRVIDNKQAEKIYNKINSIPDLRPYDLIINNYPTYDDMYHNTGLFEFGHWVNGGHWTTCEARMLIGYYRVGAYQDALKSFKRMLELSVNFRMDNNLTNFGKDLYQPNLPINVVYDSWGAPGGFMRGIFEYIYTAEGVTLTPHIPEGVKSLTQKFPIYFGNQKIYISTVGKGAITLVKVNGRKYNDFDAENVYLKPSQMSGEMVVEIAMGGAEISTKRYREPKILQFDDITNWDITRLARTELNVDSKKLQKIYKYYHLLAKNKKYDSYEFKYTQLILESIRAIDERVEKKANGVLKILPEASQNAADKLYVETVAKLVSGLESHISVNRARTEAKLWDQL